MWHVDCLNMNLQVCVAAKLLSKNAQFECGPGCSRGRGRIQKEGKMRKIASRRGIIVALAIIAAMFLLSHGLTFAGVGTVTPTIVTTPNPINGTVGTVLNDSAALSDGLNPTGTITFNLYDVNDPTCGGVPIFTNTVTVSDNGVYSTSTGFTTVEAGTYHWLATYSGDASNDSVTSICSNEAVAISNKPPGGTGESPYIGIVGNDVAPNPFYFSPKYLQFMLDQSNVNLAIPVCDGSGTPVKGAFTRVWGGRPTDKGCEAFESNKPINQPEICDVGGSLVDDNPANFAKGMFNSAGEKNAVVTKQNTGWFKWWIRLPKKPSGEINICIQCGVLKPNTFTPFTQFNAVEECAAETGERVGTGFCTRDQVAPGRNPIKENALPTLEVTAYPGPYAPVVFPAFHLTAYKNPGAYNLATDLDDKMCNTVSLQVLDGSDRARVLLKSCLDKCVVAKIPVTGQMNVLGEWEFDLEAGDLIYVRMDVPFENTVNIYCHSQSAKIMGVGESPL